MRENQRIRFAAVTALLLPVMVVGQTAAPSQLPAVPHFDVAVISPAVPVKAPDAIDMLRSFIYITAMLSGPDAAKFFHSGSLHLRSLTLEELITIAYKEMIPDQDWSSKQGNDYLKAGPDWIRSDHFDVLAELPRDATADQARLMFQALLAERFHLKVHREEKLMPAYALMIGEGGLKLQSSAETGSAYCRLRAGAPPLQVLVCQNVTMQFLSERLPYYLSQPVTDLTGISGTFDLQLDIAAGSQRLTRTSTVLETLDKLGLKLEPREQLMPVLVVDQVDRIPTQN